uniref:Uncharacterized protein n=1 Tax=Lotus japonicus TaxID=34305 RepID=I3SE99_LOTJA|nr:unknown [Lotus japonicus]
MQHSISALGKLNLLRCYDLITSSSRSNISCSKLPKKTESMCGRRCIFWLILSPVYCIVSVLYISL